MDRKTLEAVEQLLQHRYNQASRLYDNSLNRETKETARHTMSVCTSLMASISVMMSSEPEPVKPTTIDDTLSWHDIRKQLDEARAELARIARLAQEAIRLTPIADNQTRKNRSRLRHCSENCWR